VMGETVTNQQVFAYFHGCLDLYNIHLVNCFLMQL